MEPPDSSLRQHYEAQRLEPEKAQAILAAGRAAAARRRRRRGWSFAAAALLAFGGLAVALRPRPTAALVLSPQDLAAAVVAFFDQPHHDLGRVSADRGALQAWLGDHGATAAIPLPPSLARLESLGCQVLEIRGQRVSLLCLFSDSGSGSSTTAARPLLHVLVAPKSAFSSPPRPGASVRLDAVKGWNFLAWTRDDLVLVAAAEAPPERLAGFLHTL